MSRSSFNASAPGNVFFFGEFAVIYNKPCVIASVDRRTTVSVSLRSDDKVAVDSAAFGRASAVLDKRLGSYEGKATELYPVLDFIGDIASKLGVDSGFDLSIKSDVPVNSGMSSSTAVFCSILKAVSAMAGREIDNKDYFDWIYPHQVKIHGGKASGSEIVSSSVGGFNMVRKTDKGVKFDSLGEHKFSVVIGDTMVSAPTSLTVGYHLPSMEKRFPRMVSGIFNSIEKLALDAREPIQCEDIDEIGRMMNENQKLLVQLGMSHPKLDDCINAAIDAGAAGAKLSGGGWGGIMVALCYPKDQNKVMKGIADTGANVIKTEIGVAGARSE
ncbi:MAG: mevalonate kinase [archaeon]